MGQRSQAARREDKLTTEELEIALWRHRIKFRENYIKPDTPHWKRYALEIIATDRPAGEKLLGIVLALHADEDTGQNAYPSQRRIEALTSISRPTLRLYVVNLQKDGWVTKEQGAGRTSNSHTLTIPDRTIAELVARFAAACGNATNPLEKQNEARSGQATYPLERSGKATYPQIDSVVGKPLTLKDTQRSRSGKIDPRSGLVAFPNLLPIDTVVVDAPKTKTRLPKEWLTPERRAYAMNKGLAEFQIKWLAEDFQEYWWSAGAKDDGLKLDWDYTWQRRVRDAIDKERLPKRPPGLNGKGPLQSPGRGTSTSYFNFDDGVER